MGRQSTFVGRQATWTPSSVLRYPLKRGVVSDWDSFEKLYGHACQDNRTACEEHPVLFLEPNFSPPFDRERICQLAMEV